MKVLKNKLVLSITLMVLMASFGYSQNETISEITYKKKVGIAIDNSKLDEYTNNFMKEVIEHFDRIEYSLFFNNKKSIFKYNEMVNSEANQSFTLEFAIGLGGGGEIVYMDNTLKKMITKEEVTSDIFLITETLDRKWILSNENKKIEQFNCLKATSSTEIETVNGTVTKEVIAWYCPEIPVPFGPVGYGGLPGVILELQIGKFIFYSSKIILKSKKNIKIIPPEKGYKITREEFKNIQINGFDQYRK